MECRNGVRMPVQVHNISLRMLHITKQSPLQRLFIVRLQKFLRETKLGTAFFGAVAKPKASPKRRHSRRFSGLAQAG